MTKLFSFISLPLFAVGSTLLLSSPANAFTPSDVKPYITRGSVGFSQSAQGTPSQSFGFFFESNSSNNFINALGFSAQVPWLSTNLTYSVQLWEYLTTDPGGPGEATSYTSLAQVSFNPSNPGLLVGTDYWKELPSRVTLADTLSDPNRGYVISAAGSFANNTDPALKGNLIESGVDVVLSPLAIFDGAGFNQIGFAEYPVPVFDPGLIGASGYWNANFSIDVPGPLPMLGVGSAFVWSRRLKRKMNSKL